jgi:hypothetical protein
MPVIPGIVMAAKKIPELKPDIVALARAAGLDKALAQFPADIAAAARGAASARDALPVQDNVAAEPWPPMRVRDSS